MKQNTNTRSRIPFIYSEDVLFNLIDSIYNNLTAPATLIRIGIIPIELEIYLGGSLSAIKNICSYAKQEPLLIFNYPNNQPNYNTVKNMCWQKIEEKLDNRFVHFIIRKMISLYEKGKSENEIKENITDYIKKNIMEKAMQETLQEFFPEYRLSLLSYFNRRNLKTLSIICIAILIFIIIDLSIKGIISQENFQFILDMFTGWYVSLRKYIFRIQQSPLEMNDLVAR